MEDITKTGALNWRQLQNINAFKESGTPDIPPSGNVETSDEDRKAADLQRILSSSINTYNRGDNRPVGIAASKAGYGDSKYDENVYSERDLENINDLRYSQQDSGAVLANGAIKMLGLAGTTFLSSFGNLVVGIPTAIGEGRFSGLWDNPFSQAMSGIDNLMEENFTNYVSDYQQQSPSWRLGDMNWWADNFIKNIGFTLGAAAAGSLFSGGLGAMGAAMNLAGKAAKYGKYVINALSSLFSAAGEGAIEAKNLMNDMEEKLTKQLDASLAPEYEEADREYERTGDIKAYRDKMTDIDRRREAGLQDIHNRVLDAGNTDFWMNIPILTASNMIQFGKMFNKSYANARRVAEQSGRIGVGNVSRKTAEETMKATAKRAATEGLKEGERIAEYTAKEATTAGKIWAWLKNPIAEGNEEMAQQFASSMSGRLYSEEDASEYWRAKLDKESTDTTKSFLSGLLDAVQYGLKNSYLSGKEWEQGFIGALTGGMGIVMPTVKKKVGKDGKLHRSIGINWSGGSFQDYKDYMAEINGGKRLADNLNSRIDNADFAERLRNQVAHAYYQNRFDGEVLKGDKKKAKDELDKQFAIDVESFVRAGKTEDLRAIYNEFANADLSDEDIDGFIQSATQSMTAEQDAMLKQEKLYPDLKKKQTNMVRAREAFYRYREYLSTKKGRTNKERQKLDKLQDRFEKNLKTFQDAVAGYNNVKGVETTANPYFDRDGNPVDKDGNKISLEQLRTNVKTEIKDNAKKAIENLDMYLKASGEVHEATKGQYTEGQEDWLTFHNYRSKRSKDRAEKLLRERAGDLPLTVRVDGTRAKSLAEKYKGVTVEEKMDRHRKPKYYVTVDPNVLTDEEFANVYESILSDELALDSIDEQLDKRRKDKKSGTDRGLKHISLVNDVNDFMTLRTDSALYESLYNRGLKDPSFIDSLSDKEEKKAEKKAESDKFEGQTVSDIVNNVLDGNTSGDEIRKAANDGDDDTKSMMDAVQAILNGKTEVDKAADKTKLTPEMKAVLKDAVDRLARNVNTPEEFDEGLKTLDLSPEDMHPEMDSDEVAEATKSLQEAVATILNERNANKQKRNNIPNSVPKTGNGSTDETGKDPVTQAGSSNTSTSMTNPSASTNPIVDTSDLISQIREFLKQSYGSPEGAFRSTTTRFRYHNTDIPYHETISDKNSVEYKRSKAIYEYLDKEKAFDRVENPGGIHGGQKLHIVARDFSQEIFGKNFSELDDADKEMALVLLMVDDNNNVLGDLPLAQFEPSFNPGDKKQQSKAVTKLEKLQKQVLEAFKKKREKINFEEAVIDDFKRKGAPNLNLKREDGKNLITIKIAAVNKGTLPLLDSGERNTLNDVMDGPFCFAAFTISGGYEADNRVPLSVVKPTMYFGQPYIVIPTAGIESYAVPVFFDNFNTSTHRETKAYKIMHSALEHMAKGENVGANAEAFFQLLQLEAFEDAELVERDGDKWTFNFAELTPVHMRGLTPQKPVIITVTANDATEAATKVLEQLNGRPFNVRIRNSNTSPGFYPEVSGSLSYSEIMGEIGTVNLPKNTPHSVNSWFSIQFDGDIPEKNNTSTSGKHTHVINGKSVVLDYDTYTIEDMDGNPVFADTEMALALAQVKRQKLGTNNPFGIIINNMQYTFNPNTNVLLPHKANIAIQLKAPISTKQTTHDVEAVVNRIHENSKKIVLCDADGKENSEGDFYKNTSTGLLYARATSMIEGNPDVEPFDENSPGKMWILPSTTVGNQTDEHIREHVEDRNKPKTKKVNLTSDSLSYIENTVDLIKSSLGPSWTMASRNLTVAGTVQVKDPSGNLRNVRVAGTLDMLLYNKTTGKYMIFDVKTHHGDTHPDKWRAQLSIYKQLLEQQYPEMKGNIVDLAIIPFTAQYKAGNYSKAPNGVVGTIVTDSDGNHKFVPLEARVFFDCRLERFDPKTLDINMGKQGFKKAYTSKEGLEKITESSQPVTNQPASNQPAPSTHGVSTPFMPIGDNSMPSSPILVIKESMLNSISGYFGGSKALTDDFPEVPIELMHKLGDYFKGNSDFSDSDFAELQKYIRFKADNTSSVMAFIPERIAQAQPVQPAQQPPAQPPQTQGVSIQEIEQNMSESLEDYATARDIWQKIPDNLKLKMFNSGAVIEVSDTSSSVTIDSSMTEDEIAETLSSLMENFKEAKEAPKAMRKTSEAISVTESEEEARKWLEKNLPALSSAERTMFVDKLISAGKDANLMWGCFRNGIIQILRNAPAGTVYHEAFHYVFDFVLTQDEKDTILNTARSIYNMEESSDLEVEEKLAEEFRKYVIDESDTSIAGKIKRWFKKILNSIKKWMKVDNSAVTTLFHEINTGAFANRSVASERYAKNQQRVLREIRDIRYNKFMWENLDGNVIKALEGNGITRQEYESMCIDEREQWVNCKGG